MIETPEEDVPEIDLETVCWLWMTSEYRELLTIAKQFNCVPDKHGYDKMRTYKYKGDHHDDARYTYPARRRLVRSILELFVNKSPEDIEDAIGHPIGQEGDEE